MKKQVKFSIDEVNLIVGQYVIDKGFLGDIKHKGVDIIFHFGNNADDSYIVVEER